MYLEKESCGSIIKIDTKGAVLDEESISHIYWILETFEHKYSRFIEWNFLHQLNESWRSLIDDEFRTLFKVSSLLNTQSQGYFDITVLPFLENAWYGIERQFVKENIWMQNIECTDNEIMLHNGVKIDFWAIGKGYLVDQIYQVLIQKYENMSIDFWGDTKIGKQKEKVWLEDPFDSQKLIWEIIVTQASICSSSGQKRKFWNTHHLVNPFEKNAVSDKIAVYTKHPLATFADAYSTAIFVAPLEIAISMIEANKNLEALMILQDGNIYKSDGFDAVLY